MTENQGSEFTSLHSVVTLPHFYIKSAGVVIFRLLAGELITRTGIPAFSAAKESSVISA